MLKVNDAVFDRRLLNHSTSYQDIADAVDNPGPGVRWRLRVRLKHEFRHDYFPIFAVEAALVLRL